MRSADIRKDDAAPAAPELTAGETSGVERSSQTAVELGGKRRIRYFVSYSNKDRKLKDDLLHRLEDRFAIAKKYRFEAWQDKDIELGSDWHGQIQAAISICDFGLLLVSPAFLATPYIADHELPKFVADDPFQPAAQKCVAPVALKPIGFDGRMDLRGLEQRQVFRDRERRAYQQRTGNNQKDEFVDELFGKIIDMLDRHLSAPFGAPDASLVERSIGSGEKLDLTRSMHE